MKAETADCFAAARRQLDNAARLLALGFPEDAGRNCYLAGMNASRGLLFEDAFEITRRHKTLYGALSQALHARGIRDVALTSFLPVMASLKAIADYETGGDGITRERAAAAITTAVAFVEALRKIAAAPAAAS